MILVFCICCYAALSFTFNMGGQCIIILITDKIVTQETQPDSHTVCSSHVINVFIIFLFFHILTFLMLFFLHRFHTVSTDRLV